MIFQTMTERVQPLIKKIHAHPFNQELAQGTLSEAQFIYYLQQDALYLQDFAKALALISTKLPAQESAQFVKLSLGAIEAEQALHQDYLRHYQAKSSVTKNRACFAYTNYLLSTSCLKSVEEAIASVLPCFWIYLIVGEEMRPAANNPYQAWISMYSSKAFHTTVDYVITITNHLAQKASQQCQTHMLEAFTCATELEWHFWNDAYQLTPSFGELIHA